MEQTSFPPINAVLLDELNKRFPERSPDLSHSLDEIRFQAGQREVIRFLNHQFKLQNEKVLEQEIL